MTSEHRRLEAVSEGIMTVPAAAEFLSVSGELVRQLMDDGTLNFVDYTKPGGVRRVRRPTRKSVLEYAASLVVISGQSFES